VAPALIWFELASICLKKIKAHPDLEDQILQAFHLAGNLDIESIEVDHGEVVQLAREHRLTTYDANYLWLTRLLKGQLVTLDERLLKEARK
jgi:predicted nucleic acid-binding protein